MIRESTNTLLTSDCYKTYLPKVCWVAQHVHIKQLCHIPATVCIVFLSEGRPYSSTLFLDHLALLCLCPGCPDGPDQLPQSDRSWHSLENIQKRNTMAAGNKKAWQNNDGDCGICRTQHKHMFTIQKWKHDRNFTLYCPVTSPMQWVCKQQ